MNAPPEKRHAHENEAGHCLARSVADTLAEEPGLEAVTIDRAHQKISVATLGRTDVEKITARISRELQSAQAASAGRHCNLLEGKNDCATCDLPLSRSGRLRAAYRHLRASLVTLAV